MEHCWLNFAGYSKIFLTVFCHLPSIVHDRICHVKLCVNEKTALLLWVCKWVAASLFRAGLWPGPKEVRLKGTGIPAHRQHQLLLWLSPAAPGTQGLVTNMERKGVGWREGWGWDSMRTNPTTTIFSVVNIVRKQSQYFWKGWGRRKAFCFPFCALPVPGSFSSALCHLLKVSLFVASVCK